MGRSPSTMILTYLLTTAAIGAWVSACSSTQGGGVGGAEEMAAPPPAGSAGTGQAGTSPAAERPAAPARYVIGPGDTLQIRFLYHPYFNDTIPVRPDGRISLQLLQDLPAAGLTPGQLRYYLMKKYEKVIENPELTVSVKAFGRRPTREEKEIYVGGEVFLPKKLMFRENLTVLQAVYEVGGFKDTANLESVLVIRDIASANRQVMTVNMAGVIEGNLMDLPLQDTDVIYVPRSFIAQADLFVDQYLNRIVPRWVMTGFSFSYPLTEVDTNLDIRFPQAPP